MQWGRYLSKDNNMVVLSIVKKFQAHMGPMAIKLEKLRSLSRNILCCLIKKLINSIPRVVPIYPFSERAVLQICEPDVLRIAIRVLTQNS